MIHGNSIIILTSLPGIKDQTRQEEMVKVFLGLFLCIWPPIFLSGDFGPKSLFQSLGAACWRISEREQQSLLHDLFDWFSML